MLSLSSNVRYDHPSFPPTKTTMSAKTTRIAISGYKNSRKSHVGIHLWGAPSSLSSTMNSSCSKKRKQVMIVHIDDHSIFAASSSSSSSATTKESSSALHQESIKSMTLKVGMKLISVNGITIRQHHSIQDIYTMLQNAVGCVTLLVGTPTIANAMCNTDETDTTYDKISLSDACLLQQQQQQHDYDDRIIPDMKPLIANDEYGSSSASSSFSSSSSSSSSSSHPQNWYTASSINDEDSDEEDEEESIMNNAYALEDRIRSIWSPILSSNGSGSMNNRQRYR